MLRINVAFRIALCMLALVLLYACKHADAAVQPAIEASVVAPTPPPIEASPPQSAPIAEALPEREIAPEEEFILDEFRGDDFADLAADTLEEAALCDSVEGNKLPGSRTKEAKRDTRRRVQRACRAMGMSNSICVMMDVIVCRESSCGVTSVRHTRGTRGKGENGLGAMGLSLRWQSDKWPGRDEDPMFCVPEVSAVVTSAIFWRALKAYDAKDFRDLQAIFAGRFFKDEFGKYFAKRSYRGDRDICNRLASRGINCKTKINRAKLGRFIPKDARRQFVERLRAKGTP